MRCHSLLNAPCSPCSSYSVWQSWGKVGSQRTSPSLQLSSWCGSTAGHIVSLFPLLICHVVPIGMQSTHVHLYLTWTAGRAQFWKIKNWTERKFNSEAALIPQPFGPCCRFLTSEIFHLESYSQGAYAIGNTCPLLRKRGDLNKVLLDKPFQSSIVRGAGEPYQFT